jgi:AsmA protein
MKYLRYALYVLGTLVLLAIVAIGILVATFDPNDHKARVVQLVKDKTGRTLSIGGDIELKVFPKLGVQLGALSLSERDGGGEFAHLEAAQVYVALLPLLSSRLVVDEVRVDGLRANLIKFEDGSTNFDDLIEAEGAPSDTTAPPQTGRPIELDVDGIRVSDSRLTWQDRTTGNDLAVQIAELNTGRIADKRPSDIRLSASVQGAKPRLDLRMGLTGTLTFDLEQQLYRLQKLAANLEGAAMDFSSIAVKLQGDVEALAEQQRVALSGLRLQGKASHGKNRYDLDLSAPAIESTPDALAVRSLSLAASGSLGGIQLIQSSVKAPAVRVNLARNQVLVEGLTLSAKAKQGEDKLDVGLSAPRLQVTPESAGGESVVLTLKLDGAQRDADATVRVSGLEGSARALKVGSLALELDARQQDNAIKGRLTTPVTGNLETKVFELPKLVGDFIVTGPTLPGKSLQVPLSGLVRADLGKERVYGDIATRFDESNVKAKAGMTGFAAPAYDFDVTIDALNVDKYRAPGPKEAGAPAQGPQREEPIDLSALKRLNLKGDVRIGRLQASNVKAANVRVSLRARDGKLDVDPLSANLYQGSAKGAIAVDANGNRFSVNQTLTGVAIGPLLRDAAQKDILEGKGSVALNVTTRGATVSELKRALDGSARTVLRDGAVKGIDLAGTVRRVKSKLTGGDVEGTAGEREKTDFSEMSASFTIRKGVAHNEDLDLKSPFLRVTGSGDVDIAQSSIDYVVNTAVVGTMAGQGGKELTELRGLTIPVRVAGPFDKLSYKVQFSQMVRGSTKEQLEGAKRMGKEALESATRGKLEELLGRRGGPEEEGQPGGEQAQQAAPKRPEDELPKRPEDQLPKRPEDQLKGKLKELFR